MTSPFYYNMIQIDDSNWKKDGGNYENFSKNIFQKKSKTDDKYSGLHRNAGVTAYVDFY